MKKALPLVRSAQVNIRRFLVNTAVASRYIDKENNELKDRLHQRSWVAMMRWWLINLMIVAATLAFNEYSDWYVWCFGIIWLSGFSSVIASLLSCRGRALATIANATTNHVMHRMFGLVADTTSYGNSVRATTGVMSRDGRTAAVRIYNQSFICRSLITLLHQKMIGYSHPTVLIITDEFQEFIAIADILAAEQFAHKTES